MKHAHHLVTVVIALALAAILTPSLTYASNADDVLENAPVVRRQLQLRAARHEVTGLMGLTLADPFIRNVMPGARYDYHMFDWLGFGGRLQVGVPMQAATFSDVDVKVARSNETFVMEATNLQLLATAHVSVSPVVGKLLAFDSLPINFDVHFDLSAGVASVASTGENIRTGVGFAGGAGGGIRIFFSRVLALTVDLEALLVDRALSVNRDSKETGRKARFNKIVNFGVSFFMPPKLKRAE